MSQADFCTSIAFRAERQAEVRAKGEVVGGGGAVSGANLGVRE